MTVHPLPLATSGSNPGFYEKLSTFGDRLARRHKGGTTIGRSRRKMDWYLKEEALTAAADLLPPSKSFSCSEPPE